MPDEMATLDAANVSTKILGISDSPQRPVCGETNEGEETIVNEVVAVRLEHGGVLC